MLDVGCGIGGPARYLAATFGCRVTGIDLSPEFIGAATYLTARCGLLDRITIQVGDALHLPFEDAAFDTVFLQHVAMELTADGGEQLFIPIGFGHAFCTLEPDTVVTYKVNAYYAPKNEGGFHWRTPELGIQWPCSAEEGVLSPKDAVMPDHIDPEACFP